MPASRAGEQLLPGRRLEIREKFVAKLRSLAQECSSVNDREAYILLARMGSTNEAALKSRFRRRAEFHIFRPRILAGEFPPLQRTNGWGGHDGETAWEEYGLGIAWSGSRESQNPHPVSAKNTDTTMGHPRRREACTSYV